ncbi:tetratricopeptide repeat-containing diguanylate cyclase [Dyella kyungheensis]|jgi:diguanylate cyclase (GGDEF)-like protein|uniref:diguanylate cyclase n=1 Tax=Dyella kyungheensis TaxID=1242174 RepID=A0ABS2JL64_9GAMM|nr:GGDEF domain-containing protein [Dyella kyungheensis]MBM7119777.1 diguanylate cyclase [Dyella kyungheensis]
MPQRWRRYWPWLASAGLALCVLAEAVHAAPEIADPGAFLEQTERVRTSDHPRFVLMLEQMRSEAPQLTSGQRWYLRYLEAWQTAFEGDAPKANSMLRDVIDHSGDITLKAKASALLMHNLGISNHYEEAFTLANQLASELPEVTDKLTRFTVLANLSQLMVYAGQTDLAIKYARMMEDTLPPGETLCNPLSMELSALDKSNRLTSSSPMLQEGIDTCLAAGQPVFANTLRLIKSSLYLNEGQPTKALDLLKRILPSITASRYYSHMRGVQEQLALTYEKLGEDNNARKAALAVLAMSEPDEISEWLRETYDLLYRIEKKRGNLNATLTYYELYAAQDKGYLDDISARSLAYAAVQQHVLAQKLETEGLSKQNSILRLQQALDTKAVETSRLYIILLLLVLVSIFFWLLRIKRSQLRFKMLSHHDGLTGIFNHQHFVSEAERTLRGLEKRQGSACLISIDLDHFKQINDTHGHATGDVVLKHTVALCQRQLRPTDLFGRLGGEEFGILLPECTLDQGMAIADRIRTAIEATPVNGEGGLVAFSASIGLASTDTSGYELQHLRKEADAALYRAKRTGRNRVMSDTESEGLVKA